MLKVGKAKLKTIVDLFQDERTIKIEDGDVVESVIMKDNPHCYLHGYEFHMLGNRVDVYYDLEEGEFDFILEGEEYSEESPNAIYVVPTEALEWILDGEIEEEVIELP